MNHAYLVELADRADIIKARLKQLEQIPFTQWTPVHCAEQIELEAELKGMEKWLRPASPCRVVPIASHPRFQRNS